MRTLICLVAVALAVAGCAGPQPKVNPPEPPVELIADPMSSQPCGPEVNRHGQGYDAAARDCFWQAYTAGKAVHFTTTSYTTEGDPIKYEVEVLPPRIRVYIDSQDKFGTQGQFEHQCKSIERVPQKYASEERYSFVLKGCTGTDEIYFP